MNQHVPPVTPVLDQGSLIQPVTGLELLEDMLRKFLFSHEGVPRQQAYQEKRHSFQHQQDQKPLPQAFQNHPGQGAASFPCSRASSKLISSNKWLSRSRGCHPRTSGLFK